MNSVTIEFELSECGQKAAIKAGMPPQRQQAVTITDANPRFAEAVDLGEIDGGGKVKITLPTYRGDAKQWDNVPTIDELLDSYQEKRRCLEQKKTKAAEDEENAIQLELAKGPEGQISGREREQWPWLWSLAWSNYADDPRIAALREEAARRIGQHNASLKTEEAAKQAAEQEEQQDWINRHGSAHLKRVQMEGIACKALYRDERLALERPGWRWEQDVDGRYSEARDPNPKAIAFLDEARIVEPTARLVHWKYDDYDYEHEWAGYVAVANFLGAEIVCGGPTHRHD